MRKLVVTENITVDVVIDMAAAGSTRSPKTSISPTSSPRTRSTPLPPTRCLSVATHSRPSETSGPSRPTIRPVCPTTSTA